MSKKDFLVILEQKTVFCFKNTLLNSLAHPERPPRPRREASKERPLPPPRRRQAVEDTNVTVSCFEHC